MSGEADASPGRRWADIPVDEAPGTEFGRQTVADAPAPDSETPFSQPGAAPHEEPDGGRPSAWMERAEDDWWRGLQETLSPTLPNTLGRAALPAAEAPGPLGPAGRSASPAARPLESSSPRPPVLAEQAAPERSAGAPSAALSPGRAADPGGCDAPPGPPPDVVSDPVLPAAQAEPLLGDGATASRGLVPGDPARADCTGLLGAALRAGSCPLDVPSGHPAAVGPRRAASSPRPGATAGSVTPATPASSPPGGGRVPSCGLVPGDPARAGCETLAAAASPVGGRPAAAPGARA